MDTTGDDAVAHGTCGGRLGGDAFHILIMKLMSSGTMQIQMCHDAWFDTQLKIVIYSICRVRPRSATNETWTTASGGRMLDRIPPFDGHKDLIESVNLIVRRTECK